jgi:hypothetical protein
MKLGYKFEFIEGYEFDKYPLFDSYVYDFYEQKKLAPKDSALRYICKLHLNSLYGVMGRKQELIKTINVRKEELYKYAATSIIQSMISITEDIYVLLISDNLNTNILNELNVKLQSEFKSFPNLVNSNVAIASAVTSYARIHMIPFKLNTDCYYSDTDSIFIKGKLDPLQIGDDLGLMIDELKGETIKEAYFLGLKQYGYSYFFNDPDLGIILKEASIFAGIKRDSLSLLEIKKMHFGGNIKKTIPSKFFKSFTNLSIKIKDIKLIIKANRDKKLIDNIYYPLHILQNEVKINIVEMLITKIKYQFLKIKKIFS